MFSLLDLPPPPNTFVVYCTEYTPKNEVNPAMIEVMAVPDTQTDNERQAQRSAHRMAILAAQDFPGSRAYCNNKNPLTPGTLYKVELPNGVHLTFGVTTYAKLSQVEADAEKGN